VKVPEPVAAEPAAPPQAELALVVEAVAEPAVVKAVPEPVVVPAPAQPEIVQAAPEPVAGPVIQPIVLGQDAVPDAPAKKGWWRR
jgi:ribonuclease E